MPNIKELREKWGELYAAQDKLRKEVDARDGKWSTEEDAQLTKLHTEHRLVAKQIDDEEKAQKDVGDRIARIEEMEAFNKSIESRNKRTSFAETTGDSRKTGYSAEQREADRKVALRGWAFNCAGIDVTDEQREAGKRCGINPFARAMPLELFTGSYQQLQPEPLRMFNEKRSQQVSDPTKGGYTTIGTLVSTIEFAMLNYDGVRQAADVIRTADGNPLYWPTIDDTANQGTLVAEGGTRSAITDVAVAQRAWSAYTYTSGIGTITHELLQDSAFAWESAMGTLLSERIKRKQAVDFTTGDGVNKPNGIVTAASTGVSAASATAIVFDDMLNLKHSVDPDLRVGASFMFNDAILLALKKLKDGQSNYIWKANSNVSRPSGSNSDVIDNDPYFINQAMASTMASTAISVLYGNMKYYKIRDVNSVIVRRSDEYAWSTGKVAFVAEMRSDGNLLNPGVAPIKKLTH